MNGTLKAFLLALSVKLSSPEEPRNTKWLVKFLTAYAICAATAFIIFNNIYYEMMNNNMLKAFENGTLFLSFTGVTTNYLILFWHQEYFKKITDTMRVDIDTFMEQSEEERNIAEAYKKKQKFARKLWLFFSLTTLILFNFQSIASMVYYYFIGDFKLVPSFYLRYPAFIEDRKDNLIVYLFTYALITFFIVFTAISFWVITTLGPVSMLHACLRLELTKKRLEKLYSGELSVINEQLNIIAKDLQETYSFVELIERCYTLYYEFILKLSTFIIPFTFYQLLELVKRREFNLKFTTFIFNAITISAYPCYYSDMLMEKGEDVRLAAYSCGWEAHYHRRVRSAVLLILIRTARPVAIRTAFRTISLIALSEMFQQAYTIFNLMNAAMD